MTSIKKDLRDLIEKWKAIAITLENGFQLEHGALGANARESARVRKDCAADLESLIPRIIAAVEQAQVEAIQSAVDAFIEQWGPNNRDEFHTEMIEHLRTLTPRRVQIEAELREKMSRLHEARLAHQKIKDYWEGSPDRSDVHCNGTFLLEIRVNELLREIATLERELEAEQKGVEK